MRLMADLTINGIEQVSHTWYPASERSDAYGILRFGESLRGLDVYLHGPSEVRAVIAELARLLAEMTADPMPPASGTCPECGESRGWHRAPCDVPLAQQAAAPNPPYHMTGNTIGPVCGVEDGGYICNAQKGHDGPQHVAYGTDNVECHRWPVQQTASVTA